MAKYWLLFCFFLLLNNSDIFTFAYACDNVSAAEPAFWSFCVVPTWLPCVCEWTFADTSLSFGFIEYMHSDIYTYVYLHASSASDETLLKWCSV